MMKKVILILLVLTLFLAVSASAEDGPSLLGKPFQDFTVTDIDGNTFTLSDALKDHEVVLINFWATWCGPCRMIAPIVEEIANEYAGKVVVAKVDVDEMGELAQRYRIMNIPTLMLFKQGQLVDKAIGARPKAALEQMLNKAL